VDNLLVVEDSHLAAADIPEAVVDMKDNQAEVEEVEQNADDGVHKVEVVAAAAVEVVAVVVREE